MAEVGTDLHNGLVCTPETRAKAVRALQQMGAADIIPILGLDDGAAAPRPEYYVRAGRHCCSKCNKPCKADGVCRRPDCLVGDPGAPFRKV